MKNEKFMLDLFLGELRSNYPALAAAQSPNADIPMLENVARSLKTSARLVGFVELAALFNKLEELFASGGTFSDGDKNAAECLQILKSLGGADSDTVEARFDEMLARVNACANAGFKGCAKKAPTKGAQQEAKSGTAFEKLPEIDASMKELFTADVSSQVELISNALVELGADFSSKPKLEALMRASHSIKGAGRAVGMDAVVELTHKMEDCFSAALRDKITLSDNSIDVFLSCADFLGQLCRNGFAQIDTQAFSALKAGLDAVESGREPPTAPRPAAATQKDKGAPTPRAEKSAESSYIRISLSNINSIMSLAAESVIENRKFGNFRDSIANLFSENSRICNRLEEVLNMLSAEAKHSAAARLERAGEDLRAQNAAIAATLEKFSDYARKNIQLSSDLYDAVFESRMRPFSDLAHGLPKMVRDFSRGLGKKIVLEISGAAASIDRDILEKLDAPLTHLLRNACDHGIETPEARGAAGKPPTGRISIKASHASGMFLLTVSDDGRGIDKQAVKAKILERKLVPPEILEQMQEDEIFEFLFLPAFTTKEKVTEISGRGVGLDVVQTMLREVGGSVGISSKFGEGCTFTLKLPITRSVLKSLIVHIDGQPYAFPLASVNRTVMVGRSEIHSDSRGKYLMSNKSRINLVDAAEVLGFGKSADGGENAYAVVVSGRGKFWGFAVDSIPEENELVVRPLNTSLGKIACVAAAALTAEGLPVLILDIDDILIYAARMAGGSNPEMPSAADSGGADKKRVLVVDDSATVREVEKKILESAGFSVDTAVDGVDGWNVVRLSKYDLVVSDVDMPRMSGLGLTSKIRTLYPDLPVVIISYKDRPEDKRKGLECGANAYLTKSSFQDDSFVKTVQNLTAKTRD